MKIRIYWCTELDVIMYKNVFPSEVLFENLERVDVVPAHQDSFFLRFIKDALVLNKRHPPARTADIDFYTRIVDF